ncbi:hypothetical protein [Spiroplasma platyhelix]|uniref:Uncharacterized protein n=1 Tax=Spiroplasma platyhelix PALS-1 TaxID=1276218 RepID=A0A846U2K0_9MOLU|nr:hypothetical protein [Spiroplasma platyhelix]MBE4704377.1 hypothetical protein [Spiroplasma platyhelix PALS-1]NKE38749.1 hypothetical protein [Spiroplasma platyhelix PALS-1]UJB28960.1 hypothetical protein SPLAT_v1c01950 [Spiroplasma platyhelix PALS-1]
MSYYYKNEYKFSDHALNRAKTRLNLKDLSDSEVINHCLKLIELSHEMHETKTCKYINVNKTNLYFVVDINENLIITLSPFKPDRLLGILNS